MTAIIILLIILAVSQPICLFMYLKHLQKLEVMLAGKNLEDFISVVPETNAIATPTAKDITEVDPEVGMESIKKLVKKHGR